MFSTVVALLMSCARNTVLFTVVFATYTANCFFSGVAVVVDLVYGCIETMSTKLNRESRHNFMLKRVRECMKDFSKLDKNGRTRAEYDWCIGEAPGPVLSGLCRRCFGLCYNTSHNLVDACCSEIRPGHIQKSSDRALGDRTAVKGGKEFFKELGRLAKLHDYQLSADDKALMLLPNSTESIDCYSWMRQYFNDYGEHVPNSDQIHLEHVPIKSIWEEYTDDPGQSDTVSYKQFVTIWVKCFPHVRIREYKQCCAKCKICFKLSEARRGTKDKAEKDYITYMHALHRSMYMGERATYALRRKLAREDPARYLSTISDGMAQLHCLLPYFANKYTVCFILII